MAYAERHGKHWRAVWYLDDVDEKGRRKRAWRGGFRTKRLARDHAEDQEAKVRGGTYLDPKRAEQPLRQWWQTWFEAQEHSPKTAETYAQAWKGRIAPRWGGVPVGRIRPIDVDQWLKQLRTELKPASVTVILAAMRGCLDEAVRNKIIDSSPMPPARKRGSARAKRADAAVRRQGVVIPPEALTEILRRMPRDDDRLLVLTALYTGMRWSEVAGMRRQFLKLDSGDEAEGRAPAGTYTLDPAEGALHEDVHSHPFYGPPKSGAGRVIDLPPFLVLLLLAYLETLPPQEECPEVFPAVRGGPRRYDTWNQGRWRPACDGRPARVSPRGHTVSDAVPPVWPGLRMHDLKHTAKAIMADGGVHTTMQDYVLGHTPPGAAARYAHPTEKMRRQRVEALQRHWEEWGWGVLPSSTTTAPPRGQLSIFDGCGSADDVQLSGEAARPALS